MTVKYADALQAARERGRPIAAFNIVDLTMIRGAVRAAQSLSEPVIIQCSVRTVRHYGAHSLVAHIRAVAGASPVPVFIHLDHCNDEAVLCAALESGFDGIMADGSQLPLDENIAFTQKWTREARALGVIAEGELGAIRGEEDGFVGAGSPNEVGVSQLLDFAHETGVDLVGTDIGTAHGQYAVEPKLDYDLVGAVVPRLKAGFVVHGASGLKRQVLGRLSALAVAKVNFSTDLKLAWARAAAQGLANAWGVPEPLHVLAGMEEAIVGTCEDKLRALGA